MTRHQRIALARHRRRVEWVHGEIMPVRLIFEGQGEIEQPMRVRRDADGLKVDPLPVLPVQFTGRMWQ